MQRRPAKSSESATKKDKEKKLTLGPTVSLPALLDKSPQTDSKFRQLIYDIYVVADLLESAREYLAEHLGVSSSQYNIIMVVARQGAENGVNVSDVATRLNVTGAFVTNEVKKLVKSGFIHKKSNPDDGRSVLLTLTPSGYAKVQAIEPEIISVNNRLFGKLSKSDFQELSRIVGSLVDGFGQTVALLKALSSESEKSGKVIAGISGG